MGSLLLIWRDHMGIIKEMINNIIEERGIMKSLSTLIGESDLVLQDSGKFELRSNNSIKIDGTFSGNIVAGSRSLSDLA
jgi:cytoskeletal protein CcmA (bactofilin family)